MTWNRNTPPELALERNLTIDSSFLLGCAPKADCVRGLLYCGQEIWKRSNVMVDIKTSMGVRVTLKEGRDQIRK